MRLTKLSLQNYGNFASLDLDFAARPGCIELLVAPNGAGKSVLRHAVSELLFGLQGTSMGFRFGHDGMRLRASAEAANGTPFGLTRRLVQSKSKKPQDWITDLAGASASPQLLDRLPREADKDRLQRLFVLDSEQLVHGGSALLQSGGDLADALLAGAGELRSARALLEALQAQRDAYAPVRKSAKTPFHAAAEELRAARLRQAASTVRPQDYAVMQQKHAEALAHRVAANARVGGELIRLGRLQRVLRTRRHLVALNQAAAWLADHLDAPRLPADLGPRLAEARRQVAASRFEQADRQRRLTVLQEQAAAIAVDEAALAEAGAIAALAEERGRAWQSDHDIPLVQAELDGSRAALAGLLRQLGSARDPADAAAEIRAAADIAVARRLVEQHGALESAVMDAPVTAMHLRRSIADHRRALADLPPPEQTLEVEQLVAEITEQGQPALLIEQAHRAAAETDAAVRAALARVPGWAAGADALMVLAAPGDAEFTRLDHAVQTARIRAEQAAKGRDGLAATLARLWQQQRDHAAGGPLPDAAAVAAARERRDHGWRLVLARLDGRPQETAELAFAADDLPPADDLPRGYEQAVRAADTLADRRADEMERVQRAVQAAEAAAQAETALAAAQVAANEAALVLTRAQAVWAEACGKIALSPAAGLAETRDFLATRLVVIDTAGSQRKAAEMVHGLDARHAAWAERLAAVLRATPGDGLLALLAAAQVQLQRAKATQTERATITGRLRAAETDLAEREAALAAAANHLAVWSQAWAEALARLGRPIGERPEVTGRVLDLLVSLEAEVAAAVTAQRRLTQMVAQLASFAAQAATLAVRLGEPRAEPAAIAKIATDRLAAARVQKGKADTLLQQREAAADDLERAAHKAAETARALADVLRTAGSATIEEAERGIALSTLRAVMEAARQEALQRLAEDGEGLSAEELQAQADSMPLDELPEHIAAAETVIKDAQQHAEQAAATAERLSAEMQALANATDASRAASDVQAAQSRLGRVLEDALVQHAAAAMLESALQSVEASADDPRLARIGAAFAALTGHAYDRVSAGEATHAGKPHRVLLAHEAGGAAGGAGGAEKQVDELSEGTRDQLYLALRLVAIEDHVAAAPALPFIADDILQTFDDARALAAFHALVSLSTHTQVVVLTHHEHLAALAQTLPEGVIRIQRL